MDVHVHIGGADAGLARERLDARAARAEPPVQLGGEEELAELGAIVIDLTDIAGTDAANHGKFAEIAQAAPELRSALQSLELRPQVSTTETTVDAVGNTAKAAITFPLKILTAPLTALSNRQ